MRNRPELGANEPYRFEHQSPRLYAREVVGVNNIYEAVQSCQSFHRAGFDHLRWILENNASALAMLRGTNFIPSEGGAVETYYLPGIVSNGFIKFLYVKDNVLHEGRGDSIRMKWFKHYRMVESYGAKLNMPPGHLEHPLNAMDI